MKKIYISLSKPGSIDNAIKELVRYKEELKVRCRTFVNKLLDEGIYVAMSNSGEYAGMIVFKREVRDTENGCEGVLIATDGQKIVRTWYASKKDAQRDRNPRSYTVSPLLLAEFGSGWLAEVLVNVDGVGQGTMPDSYGHAFDDHWAWYDANAVKHVSQGEAPTHPMYKAVIAMETEIDRIGKEIFT